MSEMGRNLAHGKFSRRLQSGKTESKQDVDEWSWGNNSVVSKNVI